MSMVIYNNLSAMTILGETNKNSNALKKSLKKVASGMKINSAADDASGYAISERMRVQIRALGQADYNSQNARSLLKVADGALSNTVDIMRSMKEKAINAANDTNTDADRAIIQKELDQQIDQINDNSQVTFNGKYLFDRTADLTNSVEQTIAAALYSEWIPNSLDLIKNSMGLSFATSSGVKDIGVYFSNESGNVLAYVTNWGGDRKTQELALTVNMNFYKDLVEGDVNGATAIPGAGYLDRTIAHELTHAVMASNIEGFSNLYACIKEGAAEVVHGIDDERRSEIKALAEDNTVTDWLTVSTSTGGETEPYSAGYIMFRFMAANSGGYSATESLSRFMQTLSEGKGVMTDARINEAVSAATKGKYDTFDQLKDAIKAARDASANGTEFLKKYCDIDLDNNEIDVGSIGGYDAGSRYEKNAEGAVWEAGSTKFWTNPLSNETIIDGLTVSWKTGTREVDFSNGAGTDVRSWRGADIHISGGLVFQTGTRASQNLRVAMNGADAQSMGLMDKDGNTLKVTTQVKAEQAIYQLDRSIDRALAQLTTIGALSSRLEYTSANLVTSSENVTAAESVIRDADMAKEMTAYTKNSVLLQAAQSMLAQANQNSSGVLSLLQ